MDVERARSVLGVDASANTGQLRAVRKYLARNWHPDQHVGNDPSFAAVRMQEVNEAFDVLTRFRAEQRWRAATVPAPPPASAESPAPTSEQPAQQPARRGRTHSMRAALVVGVVAFFLVASNVLVRVTHPVVGLAVTVVLTGVLTVGYFVWANRAK